MLRVWHSLELRSFVSARVQVHVAREGETAALGAVLRLVIQSSAEQFVGGARAADPRKSGTRRC